jgi:peptide/nickel transport system permease protein
MSDVIEQITPPESVFDSSPGSDYSSLIKNRIACIGGIIVICLICAALFAPLLSELGIIKNPLEQHDDGLNADGLPQAPNALYPLGTDNLGRDILSRVVFGARLSLTVGIVAMLTAVFIGVSVGTISGYYGGWINTLLMRSTDVVMTIPGLLLAIAFAGLMDGRIIHLHPDALEWHTLDIPLKRGLISIFLVIGIVSWTWIARVIRGQVLSLKTREFVDSARAIGCSQSHIIIKHILPNILPTIIILASLSTANTVLLDAGLSYLGVGVPPPSPSWGTMISEGQAYFIVSPHMTIVPGLAIILTVVGFNLLGQGLQEVLDPYAKGKR